MALELYAIGDKKRAVEGTKAAIARFTEEVLPAHRKEYWLASAYEILGEIDGDERAIDAAITVFEALLLEERWSPTGKALLYRHVGDCQRARSRWPEAMKAYDRAYEEETQAIFMVFRAECLFGMGEVGKALSTIQNVDLVL